MNLGSSMTIVIKTTHMITWHYDDITSQYIRYLGNLWSHETFKFTLKNKYGGFKIIKSNVIKCELRLNLSEHAQLKKKHLHQIKNKRLRNYSRENVFF